MTFIPGTPESRLRRSDSKNPATTCKGITAEGRHCRRDITSPYISTFKRHKSGVVAVLPAGDSDHDGAAAYFCWQHKDQAASLAASDASGRKAKVVHLNRRSSVDTLAERLGIVDIDDDEEPVKRRRKKRHHTNPRPARKETLPQQWQDMDGPLLAVGPGKKPPTQKKRFGMCCIQIEYEDPVPPPRPAQMAERPSRFSAVHPSSPTPHRYSIGATSPQRPSKQSPSFSQPPQHASPLPKPDAPFARPKQRRHSSHTQSLLAWMSPMLSPATTSNLLGELAKPVSTQDEEGYIYMFWLMDSFSTKTNTRNTNTFDPSHFIGDDSSGKDPSNLPRGAASPSSHPQGRDKQVMLKIGRAANVQRRMQQWTRQCGYELSVVRFYPYSPTTTIDSNAALPPTKVPFSHKVERLIHLELADQRIMKNCAACGKVHREWFEVEASTKATKKVDEVCRRWCDWSVQQQRQHTSQQGKNPWKG